MQAEQLMIGASLHPVISFRLPFKSRKRIDAHSSFVHLAGPTARILAPAEPVESLERLAKQEGVVTLKDGRFGEAVDVGEAERLPAAGDGAPEVGAS